jgi:hypothetical protein
MSAGMSGERKGLLRLGGLQLQAASWERGQVCIVYVKSLDAASQEERALCQSRV